MVTGLWTVKDIDVINAIKSSFEQVVGKVEIPPSHMTLESFIDNLQGYGFHATDARIYQKHIWVDGLRKLSYHGNYFIADRKVSEQDIGWSLATNCVPDMNVLSAGEYLEMLGSSFSEGIDWVRLELGKYAVPIFLVIDRNRAVPEERKKTILRGKELAEYRGAGFLEGHSLITNERVLDEGAVTLDSCQVSPKEAIRGVFSSDLTDAEEFAWDRTELIKKFYAIVANDFLLSGKR